MNRTQAKSRLEIILKLRSEDKTLQEIGDVFSISRERVRQIILNKDNLPRIRPTSEHPELNNFSGRDRTREMVRIRDNHTCQKCGKVWQKGTKRLDVHHLNGKCGQWHRETKYDRVSEIDGMITYCHKCHMNLDEVRKKTGRPLQ